MVDDEATGRKQEAADKKAKETEAAVAPVRRGVDGGGGGGLRQETGDKSVKETEVVVAPVRSKGWGGFQAEEAAISRQRGESGGDAGDDVAWGHRSERAYLPRPPCLPPLPP